MVFIAYHGLIYKWQDLTKIIRTQGESIFWPAVFNLVMIACFYQSLALATSTGLVVAVFRTRTLLTTIEGGRFFHENQLMKKTFACFIMMIGALMILL